MSSQFCWEGPAVAKAANVKLVARQQPRGGPISIIVQGDVGTVKAAVDAGAASESPDLVRKLTIAGAAPRGGASSGNDGVC
ncbi:hypothetical protein CWO89_03205 [Bradyrhizobium sp. Leo170]|nr:hypothetical protein CWO89_03205 [Bradyrhizobium sp. Leo170]